MPYTQSIGMKRLLQEISPTRHSKRSFHYMKRRVIGRIGSSKFIFPYFPAMCFSGAILSVGSILERFREYFLWCPAAIDRHPFWPPKLRVFDVRQKLVLT